MSHKILLLFDLPEARAGMLDLHPELRRVAMVAGLIAHLHNEGLLDAESYDLACDTAKALRNYVGVLQESDRENLTVGQRLALARLKQALRDLVHACCWPVTMIAPTHRLVLSQRAALAFVRLRLYDPIQGVSSYDGNMAQDVIALADGIAAQEVTTRGVVA